MFAVINMIQNRYNFIHLKDYAQMTGPKTLHVVNAAELHWTLFGSDFSHTICDTKKKV